MSLPPRTVPLSCRLAALFAAALVPAGPAAGAPVADDEPAVPAIAPIDAPRDTDAPVVSHGGPASILRGNRAFIRVKILDSSRVFATTFYWRHVGDAAWEPTPLEGTAPDFSVSVPPQRDFEFWIEAFDELGNGPGLDGSAASPHRIRVLEPGMPPPPPVAARPPPPRPPAPPTSPPAAVPAAVPSAPPTPAAAGLDLPLVEPVPAGPALVEPVPAEPAPRAAPELRPVVPPAPAVAPAVAVEPRSAPPASVVRPPPVEPPPAPAVRRPPTAYPLPALQALPPKWRPVRRVRPTRRAAAGPGTLPEAPPMALARLHRMATARPPSPGLLEVRLDGSIGAGVDFLLPGADVQSGLGALHLAFAPTEWLGISLGSQGRSSWLSAQQAGVLGARWVLSGGDFDVGARATRAVGPLRVGLQVDARLQTAVEGLGSTALSPQVLAVATWERARVRLHGQLGYRWDNSENLLRGQWPAFHALALGLSRYDAALAGIGVETPLGPFIPWAEYTVELPVDRRHFAACDGPDCAAARPLLPARLADLPQRTGVGVRVEIGGRVAINLGAEFSLGSAGRSLTDRTDGGPPALEGLPPPMPFTFGLSVIWQRGLLSPRPPAPRRDEAPSSAEPPAVEPPAAEPPAAEPPAAEPPAVEPPAVEPPAVEPPAVEPPAVEPPAFEAPPAAELPAVETPATEPFPAGGRAPDAPPAEAPPPTPLPPPGAAAEPPPPASEKPAAEPAPAAEDPAPELPPLPVPDPVTPENRP